MKFQVTLTTGTIGEKWMLNRELTFVPQFISHHALAQIALGG